MLSHDMRSHDLCYVYLYIAILRELVDGGQLPGSVHGRSDKATYIPSVYTEMQNQWIDNFLSSNGYLG